MGRDVNGNYSLPAGNPVVTNTIIASSWANNTLSDVATALTNSLDRTGASTGMTGQFKAMDGSIGAPGISFNNEVASGWYRAGANQFNFSINGVDALKFAATRAVTIPAPTSGTALTVLGVSGTASFITGLLGGANNPRLFVTSTEGSGLTDLAFTGSANFNGTISVGASAVIALSNNRNVTINAPASGVALTVNAVAASVAANLNSASATDSSYLYFSRGGVSSAYVANIGAANVLITGSAQGDFCVRDDGHSILFSTNSGAGINLGIGPNGNVSINAPSSGVALTVTGVAAGQVALFSSSGNIASRVVIANSTYGIRFGNAAAGSSIDGTDNTGSLSYQPLTITGSVLNLGYSGNNALSIGGSGNVTINAPSSGIALSVAGVANNFTGFFQGSSTASQSFGLRTLGGTNSSDASLQCDNQSGGTTWFKVRGDAQVLRTDTVNATLFQVGYLELPQVSQGTNYTFVLADSGKHFLPSANNLTITIPANASVAYPVGTVLTVVAGSATGTLIAITTDTLWLAGTGTTGTRSLSSFGIATAVKISSTVWLISGTGLT